jgi:hypothetical protein
MYGAAADAAGATTDTGAGAPADTPNGAPNPATQYSRYAKQANDLYVQAMTAEKAGKINDAQKLYYQALSIRQNMWGVSDPGSLSILLKLGDINVKEKHFDYAETCYKQYLGGLAKQAGPGAYESVACLGKLANLYALKQQYDEAASMLRNILALQERKFGEDSNEYRQTRINLVDALVQSKEFLEGRDVSKDGLSAEKKRNNEHSQDYLHLLTGYATCERGLHHDEEAKQAEDKVAVLKQELGTPTDNAAQATDSKGKSDDKASPTAKQADKADAKAAQVAHETGAAPASADSAAKDAPATTKTDGAK